MMPKKICLFISIMIFAVANASSRRNGFAIVIDKQSYQQAKTEVQAYQKALEEKQGLKVYLVTDKWGIPDSIRSALFTLYTQKNSPICGAVFIGDIPVPMIRDAQHMASAFKMSQDMPWQDSSIPSDRFYDSFGLQFDFIKQDSIDKHFFYYSLSAKGEQKLQSSIFSGRIRPTDADGTSRYEKLRQYLRKATDAKLNPEKVKSVFVYTGSGSLNESKVAHINEMRSMNEHFPQLAGKNRAYSYMDFSDATYPKAKLMSEMMRPDLSIGLMHHHGDYDTQYLTDYPKPTDMETAKNYMLWLLRQKLNSAAKWGQDIDSIRNALNEKYDLSKSWLDTIPSENSIKTDSILTAKKNLTLPDFQDYGYKPNCRVVIYDACYNGSFHRDNSIANEYIFQPGKTILGIGGTVNVLQDKWPDKLIGLLSEGVMAGYINMLNLDIEMHVIGDPTYLFLSETKHDDLNALLANGTEKDWKKFLRSAETPEALCLAIEKLKNSPLLSDEDLYRIQKTSQYGIVRLQAYEALAARNNDAFVKAMNLATYDDFELLQRFAVNDMVKYGGDAVLYNYSRLITDNNTSARVAFNAEQGVQFFPQENLLNAIQSNLDSMKNIVVRPKEYNERLMTEINKYAGRWKDQIIDFCEGKMPLKMQMRYANFMRIYLPPYLIEKVSKYTEETQEMELKKKLLEALGWHRQAYCHQSIIDVAQRIFDNKNMPEDVRNEALKTLKRIK